MQIPLKGHWLFPMQKTTPLPSGLWAGIWRKTWQEAWGTQKSSSAFRLLEAFSSLSRCMQSVKLLSPCTLLSRVLTFTVSLVFSFSPTTVRAWATKLVYNFCQCVHESFKYFSKLYTMTYTDTIVNKNCIMYKKTLCKLPKMKLYWANCAFLIFLFRVQPGSRSTSVINPPVWNSRCTWSEQVGSLLTITW